MITKLIKFGQEMSHDLRNCNGVTIDVTLYKLPYTQIKLQDCDQESQLAVSCHFFYILF